MFIFDDDSISTNLIETIKEQGEIGEELGEELSDNIGFLSAFFADLPEKLIKFSVKFVLAVVIFLIGVKIISLIRKLVKRWLDKASAEEGVKQFLDSFVKVLLYVVLIGLIASYFGVQTTSLVALLGSAGVTIALALQGSLSNFTGGVLILILKPFKVGDYIIEDTHGNEGTVTEIQLFYTKLRTVDDRIVVLPNGSLANTSLTNLNISPDRRVCLTVGISYDSDLKIAKKIVKKCILELDKVMADKPIDVFVDELGESAVVIGYRFFVKNDDYWSSRWQINENVKLALDEAGIEIPYNKLDVNLKEKQ